MACATSGQQLCPRGSSPSCLLHGWKSPHSQSTITSPAAATSPVNQLHLQSLRPRPRPTEPETLVRGHSNLCFSKCCRGFSWSLKPKHQTTARKPTRLVTRRLHPIALLLSFATEQNDVLEGTRVFIRPVEQDCPAAWTIDIKTVTREQ